jgi:hypothetical protein
MGHSVAAVYVDEDGSDMSCTHVQWQHFTKLQSDRRVLLLIVHWDQNPPDPPNKVEFSGHEAFSVRPAHGGQGVEITGADVTGVAHAKDTSFHEDGSTARQKTWPDKLAQGALSGPVRLLGFDYSHPNYDALLLTGRTLVDNTPVEP